MITPDSLTRPVVESLRDGSTDHSLAREIRVWLRWDSGGRDHNEYNARRAARAICDAINQRQGANQ